MLFNEVYGGYYNAVAAILREALSGELTGKRLGEIVTERAFSESVAVIPDTLKSGRWPLLDRDLNTPLKHPPTMPLTTLQKRWLKALLLDPRIALFQPPTAGLEGVEPLYTPDMLVYYDQYGDGDPYDDPGYVQRFRTVLTALREKRWLRIKFKGNRGQRHRWDCIPWKLEYSEKDDKFRLLTAASAGNSVINLGRVRSVELLEPYTPDQVVLKPRHTDVLTLEVVDERNALERVMLHFSHLEKQTRRLDGNRYRMTVFYDHEDQTEMLIRVLSFGPMVRVIEPEGFIELLKDRIQRQMSCGV